MDSLIVVGEEKVFIQSGHFKIEGLLRNLTGKRGVIVTHPHPLYGGNMFNNVVESVIAAYGPLGYSTLRFNFRGVGESEGAYDQGIGEQEDVKAALNHLVSLGKSHIDLIGYSFGAWVNALGLKGYEKAARFIFVSPPVGFLDFSFLRLSPKIRLVIAGSDDDIAPVEILKQMQKNWNPDLEFRVIEGADHFYWGRTAEIRKILERFIESNG